MTTEAQQKKNLQQLGCAVTAAVVLSDWSKYGLTERVCYHFGLQDALIPASGVLIAETSSPLSKVVVTAAAPPTLCGVTAILECVPTKQWHKLTRRQKRDLKAAISTFNETSSSIVSSSATDADDDGDESQPRRQPCWPIRLNTQTRLFFAYELTRIAFCVDASPTLTNTFGFGSSSSTSSSSKACCPMDRLVEMARTFWLSIIAPITNTMHDVWRPCIAVTVLAVYPRHCLKHRCPTSVLVRDFRVTNLTTATELADRIQEWCLGEVETAISEGLSNSHSNYASNSEAAGGSSSSSSMRDMLDAGNAALSTLSSTARPAIVVATSCRAVACDTRLALMDRDDDVPVTVLDLSSRHPLAPVRGGNAPLLDDFNLLNYDPDGAVFPLHLPDDSEAIYQVCLATGGSFFDGHLLDMATKTVAGHANNNALEQDFFFSFKRHTIQPNALQWYTLFSLSPISPRINAAWGKLPPPEYIAESQQSLIVAERKQPWMDTQFNKPAATGLGLRQNRGMQMHTSSSMSSISNASNEAVSGGGGPRKQVPARTTFSNYIINPIPIKDILLMRVKEGYRAKQYGQNTNEHDRVSIQFILPLDFGTTIHYELSYKALPGQDARLVGFAHIKIELSGDPGFILSVKNEFLHQTGRSSGRPVTMAQQFSARLCTYLRSIRKEDMLQSYLSPLKWTDQLSSPSTPFIRRLGVLTKAQIRRHFNTYEFDCVCVGQMPWDDTDFLGAFRDTDDGAVQLIEAIENWSTQTIRNGQFFVRQIPPEDGVAGYCVVEVVRSRKASRIFTISLGFGGIGTARRQALIASLKEELRTLPSIEVLSKQIAQFVVGTKARNQADPRHPYYQVTLESHHNHASWDLIKDPELLPLLMKRRKEIGQFLLLESSDDHALFAKLDGAAAIDQVRDPGNLVQYQFQVLADKVVVELDMESESGNFFPFRASRSELTLSTFHKLARSLRTRDQECGHALQCRTTLLRSFVGESVNKGSEVGALSPLSCVERLLGYASEVRLRLRFFHSESGSANDILKSLTTDMLLSQSFEAKVAKLSISSYAVVENHDPGDWFIVEYDKQTVSIVFLSSKGKSEVSQADGRGCIYRELAFFTISISDLYSRRDDVVDDESEEDHISEHIQVSEFSESILDAHKQNYSLAAYFALTDDSKSQVEFFDLDDFAEVMRTLEFVEVSRVLVAGETGSSKLETFLATALQPIADENYCLFYESNRTDGNFFLPLLDDDSDCGSMYAGSNDHSVNDTTDNGLDDDLETTDDSLGFESKDFEASSLGFVAAPIFVRFLLDSRPVSTQELQCIKRSANLSVLVSVFKANDEAVPKEHRKVNLYKLEPKHRMASLELSALLNAYVAEQTLERLRCQGSSIQELDIRLAKSCMSTARNILKATVDVFFFVPKSDSIVAASAPSAATFEMEEGFNFLVSELRKSDTMRLRSYASGDSFLVEEGTMVLAHWCFLKLRREQGVITVEIHHPGGPQPASKLMKTTIDMISAYCHRVNQLLLLRSLHRSRTASRYLIVADLDTTISGVADEGPFLDGVFSCPVVYRTSFGLLYHRCAANPSQVARKLEATVLHNFAVSNRRNVFVYKDEAGSVFYMSLATAGGGAVADTDAKIELLVRGIDEPSTSITQQLRDLLQRRILLIAVDMLSAVLAKNPQFHWKPSDISFVRTFEADWVALDNEKEVHDKRRVYAFPKSAYDPGMILLFLRQNLCGSTFFHPLSTSEWTLGGRIGEVPLSGNLCFDETDLVFYYSTSPSKLDSNFQSESTLTGKGAQYSRQAGSGVAIIEVSLVNAEGGLLRRLDAALPANKRESTLNVPADSLRFQRVNEDKFTSDSRKDQVFLQVIVMDTALKRNILHEWVLLSLNQVLSAWHIERHIERMQKGLLFSLTGFRKTPEAYASKEAKNEEIENICIGLPALIGMLASSEPLPHPAVLKVEYEGVIRSSAVAMFALELLEKGILKELRSEKKQAIDRSKLIIIRSSRSTKPCRVLLERDAQRRVVVRSSTEALSGINKSVIQDSPIDCPEYTIMYYSSEYIDTEEDGGNALPKLFEEVSVGYDASGDKGESVRSLLQFKKQHLLSFRRSFAFVFKVKRNVRTLMAYNWHPPLFKKTVANLQEIDSSVLVATGRSAASLQHRALGSLAPAVAVSKGGNPKVHSIKRAAETAAAPTGASSETEGEISANDQPLTAHRRLKRPQTIRRPKLVGKSVEGSAVQAVALSRARASSSRFRGNDQPGSTVNTRAKNEDSKSGRPPVAARKTADILKPSQVPDNRARPAEDDGALHAARKEFDLILSRQCLVRHSTRRAAAVRQLSTNFWPLKKTKMVSPGCVSYVFETGSLVWSEVSPLPPFPETIRHNIISSLAHTLSSWTPGLTTVPLWPPTRGDRSAYLMGKVRNVRSCKCFVVVRLSTLAVMVNSKIKVLVSSEGRVLTLPRHKNREGPADNTQSLIEKDAAGFDKLSVDLRLLLELQGKLLDHAASIVERTMKSVATAHEYGDVLRVLLLLIEERYPLKAVMATRSNYKCYEATIILRSYCDRLIDMYDGPTLFAWLSSHVHTGNLIDCGPKGLCFKREVVVGLTHSICFLTQDHQSPTKLKLVILCRTQGKNITEFMFREGSSNVAISVLDCIAVDSAGLAYTSLRIAAASLTREKLWARFSSTATNEPPSHNEITNLLSLCLVKPISAFFDNSGDSHRFAMACNTAGVIDQRRCFQSMKNDPTGTFAPAWDLLGGHLFYLGSEDVFILIKVKENGLEIDLVQQNEKPNSKAIAASAIQRLLNFLLHFLWSQMTCHA